jgi:hypothetical protein
MKLLLSLALAISGLHGCATQDELQGSQSHFVCETNEECFEELGAGYECLDRRCHQTVLSREDAGAALARGPSDTSSAGALGYVGQWHIDPETDSGAYDQYMVLTAGHGQLCVEDGKSSAEFAVLADKTGVHMGSYDYGSGDLLETSEDANRLVRSGSENGITYVSEFERYYGVLPAWCVSLLPSLAAE